MQRRNRREPQWQWQKLPFYQRSKCPEYPFEVREVEIPPLTPGAVLGRMVMAGVCGTDVHILHGKVPVRTPAVLGHENVARL
jgi:Zn-dependent alcohol dehydrogenase